VRLNHKLLSGPLLITLMAGCAQTSMPDRSQALTDDIPASHSTTTPGSKGIPECPVAISGTQVFVADDVGYCFLYPIGFQPIEPEGVPTTFITIIVGPDYSGKNGTEPLRATLIIDATQVANSRSAAQVASDLAAQFPNALITRSNLTLGGVSAVLLEGLPRQGTSREAIAVHGDRIYHLILTPVGVGWYRFSGSSAHYVESLAQD